MKKIKFSGEIINSYKINNKSNIKCMKPIIQTQMANLITSLAGQLQLKLIFHGKNSKEKNHRKIF